METKLTLWVPHHLLVNAMRYAHAQQTTLTKLISAYLERIPFESEVLENAPVVRRLTGILSPDISIESYTEHTEEKYGGS